MKKKGLYTPEFRNPVPAPAPTPALCENITIPVAEYIYLQRIDALMDTLLQADNYNNTQVVAAIRETVKGMRNPGGVGAGL